jgi:hypothetical protein
MKLTMSGMLNDFKRIYQHEFMFTAPNLSFWTDVIGLYKFEGDDGNAQKYDNPDHINLRGL